MYMVSSMEVFFLLIHLKKLNCDLLFEGMNVVWVELHSTKIVDKKRVSGLFVNIRFGAIQPKFATIDKTIF
jgi:hypothetical protein